MIIFVKMKNWWLRKKIHIAFNEALTKEGQRLFKKRQEVHTDFLIAEKRKDEKQKLYSQAQLDFIDWLVKKDTV